MSAPTASSPSPSSGATFAVAVLLVASSRYVGLVPQRVAEQYSQALGLCWFPVPAALPERDIRLFWHARLDADPAHRWLRDTIRGALGPAMSHVTH